MEIRILSIADTVVYYLRTFPNIFDSSKFPRARNKDDRVPAARIEPRPTLDEAETSTLFEPLPSEERKYVPDYVRPRFLLWRRVQKVIVVGFCLLGRLVFCRRRGRLLATFNWDGCPQFASTNENSTAVGSDQFSTSSALDAAPGAA